MNSHRSRKDSWLRVLFVFIAVAVSWVLSYIAHYFDLPIYLDTVGSVSVAFVGGGISCNNDCGYHRSHVDVILQF